MDLKKHIVIVIVYVLLIIEIAIQVYADALLKLLIIPALTMDGFITCDIMNCLKERFCTFILHK